MKFLIRLKGLLTAVISSDPALEAAVMGALDPEGSLTLADITGDLASGFDTIQNDYADVLNDPTQEFLNFIPHCPYCYTVNS